MKQKIAYALLILTMCAVQLKAQRHDLGLFVTPQLGFYTENKSSGFAITEGLQYAINYHRWGANVGIAYELVNNTFTDTYYPFYFNEDYNFTPYYAKEAIIEKQYLLIPLRISYDFFEMNKLKIGAVVGCNLGYLISFETIYVYKDDIMEGFDFPTNIGVKAMLSKYDFDDKLEIDAMAGFQVNYTFANHIKLSLLPFYSYRFFFGKQALSTEKYMNAGIEIRASYRIK
jgi:hypothetical protein